MYRPNYWPKVSNGEAVQHNQNKVLQKAHRLKVTDSSGFSTPSFECHQNQRLSCISVIEQHTQILRTYFSLTTHW